MKIKVSELTITLAIAGGDLLVVKIHAKDKFLLPKCELIEIGDFYD